jgi:transcription elongation factor GreA
VNIEYLTKDGLEKLKKELHECKFTRRPQISQKVATAREHGDLKENAEYHAAREELSLLETKIQQLQDRLSRARIIDQKDIPDDKVYLLTTVVLKDLDFDETLEYQLVSPAEANAAEGKISTTSPIGKALLGKREGEKVDINVPAGTLHYKVVGIKKPA